MNSNNNSDIITSFLTILKKKKKKIMDSQSTRSSTATVSPTTPLLSTTTTTTSTPTSSFSPSPLCSPTRLPHLDGLRALALLGVLLFHFEIPLCTGGFLGVDIFFTLSGFLITRNILHAHHTHTFSLFQFYLRRFFRLFPASAITILASLILTTFLVTPASSIAVFKSAFAALTLWSNIFFHRQGGYFDASFEMRPLLHFWSLSVEEQFYAIWPPLLLFVLLFKSKNMIAPFIVLSILTISSLVFAINIHASKPNWAFYELPSRVFQFGAGALLAIRYFTKVDLKREDEEILDIEKQNDKTYHSIKNKTQPSKPTKPSKSSSSSSSSSSSNSSSSGDEELIKPNDDTVSTNSSNNNNINNNDDIDAYSDDGNVKEEEISDVNDALSIIAILIIFLSFIFIPGSASPLRVLPVTLATTLLIAVPKSIVCQLCFESSQTIRNFGMASYSIYLVHWPIAILGKFLLQSLRISSFFYTFILLPLSIHVGYILHRRIETPLRRPSSFKHHLQILIICILAFTLATFGSITHGMKAWRFPEEGSTGYRTISNTTHLKFPNEVVQKQEFWHFQRDVKHLYAGSEHPNIYVMRVGSTTGRLSKYVFFGDSFAEHLTSALHNIGLRYNLTFQMHYAFHCGFRPSSQLSLWTGAAAGYVCADTHPILWSHVDALPKDSVVVVANWWCQPVGFEHTLFELYKEMEVEHHRKLAIFAEPPGLHESNRFYYPCADVRVLWIGRITAKLLGRPFVGGKRCISFENGVAPEWKTAAQRKGYEKAFKTFLKRRQFFDLFKHLCVVTKTKKTHNLVQKEEEEEEEEEYWNCFMPAQLNGVVHDIGYKHDLAHLSMVGSDFVTDFIDQELYGGKGSW